MFGADNRLSLAASAIMRHSEWEASDYAMDGSGELGGKIALAHQKQRVAIVESFGFTPDEYNEALRERLCERREDGQWGMSYHVFYLLEVLEVDPTEQWVEDHTFVCTLGYPGHPEAEWSSLSYLRGGQ